MDPTPPKSRRPAILRRGRARTEGQQAPRPRRAGVAPARCLSVPSLQRPLQRSAKPGPRPRIPAACPSAAVSSRAVAPCPPGGGQSLPLGRCSLTRYRLTSMTSPGPAVTPHGRGSRAPGPAKPSACWRDALRALRASPCESLLEVCLHLPGSSTAGSACCPSHRARPPAPVPPLPARLTRDWPAHHVPRGPFSVSRGTGDTGPRPGPARDSHGVARAGVSVSCEATVKSQKKSQQIRVNDHRARRGLEPRAQTQGVVTRPWSRCPWACSTIVPSEFASDSS